MKTLLALTAGLLVCSSPQRLFAQGAGSGLAQGIVEARQKNATLMKQYSWNCRIEIIENGTTKDTRIDQVTYGPDGNLQRTLIHDQGSPLPHGFLRRRIAEEERKKFETYMQDVHALLGKYSLPTAAGVGAFLGTATIQPPGATDLLGKEELTRLEGIITMAAE